MSQITLLASDMDGTVIPLEDDVIYREAIEQLEKFLSQRPHCSLVYVTGRDFEFALQGVEEFDLPLADHLICDVGTSLYDRDSVGWHVNQEYYDRLAERWEGREASEIAAMLEGVEGLIPQEAEKQARFKFSSYIDEPEATEQVIERCQKILTRCDLKANYVQSVDTVKKCGLLDILPPGVAKDFALLHLIEREKIARTSVVYAGDSGNDLAVFISGVRSVVVGNTPDKVKREVKAELSRRNFMDRVYFADNKYVLGVLEGCQYFGG